MSLLKELYRNGQLRTLDHALATSLQRLREDTPDSVAVAAALASLAVSQGHAGFDPAQPQRLLEGVSEWPAAQDWLAQLRASPWVATPEQADAIAEDAPLVLENGLLYLRRYREYERQLAAGLQRIGRHPLPAPDMAALAPLFAQLFPQASGSEDHQARAAGVTLRHPLALVTGGPGTGKTTTIAKLASRFAEKHAPRDVALVTTDTTRIGAREQLYGYGRQLGIAVHEANSGTDLDQLLERLKDYKLVLIDTAGLGPRDRALAAQLQWLRAARQVRTLLVLPANTSFGDMDEVVRRFGAANLQGLVLSKLDETGRFGNALSVAVDHALPITWVTDGQDVPEDLHRASAANLVLRLEDLRRAADMPCNPELNHAVA